MSIMTQASPRWARMLGVVPTRNADRYYRGEPATTSRAGRIANWTSTAGWWLVIGFCIAAAWR